MQTRCNVLVCPIPGYVTPPESRADHSTPQGPAFSTLGLHASLRLFPTQKVSGNILKLFKTVQQVNNEPTQRNDDLRGHRYVT